MNRTFPATLRGLASLAIAGLLLQPVALLGQGITTSAIEGIVTNSTSGQPVAEAKVEIVHESSGTRYDASTRSNGRFNVSGLRPGGPYSVSVTAGGMPTESRKGVYLDLGQTAALDFALGASEVVQMQAFTVEADRDTTFGSGKVGTGTTFSEEEVNNIASVRRNVQDIARLDSRLTIMSLDQGGQMSAQGQNFRYNSFLIDGVEANDPFGLNGNGFSSLRSPIPLESVQALSVNLTDYDVRRAGFTGALINAVTKSGGNDVSGSVYYEFTNENMRAKNPITGAKEPFDERSFGFTVGGPILKNRLFYFFAYDDFKRETTQPTANFVPDAAALQSILTAAGDAAHGSYDPGSLEGSNVGEQKTYIAKLDWNINSAHRLSLTYRKNDGVEPIFAAFNSTTTTSLSNHWYSQQRNTESLTAQLFSSWSPDFRTEISVSRTDYDGSPSVGGSPYPEVTINGVTGVRRDTGATVNGSVRFGTEFSRQLNVLLTETTNARFIGEYAHGDHTYTFGADFEKVFVDDRFVQAYYGSYTFSNIANWAARSPVTSYTLAKPFPGNTLEDGFALWNSYIYGFYMQDSWRPNQNLTLSYGWRFDYPDADSTPLRNTAFETAFGIRNDISHAGNATLAPRIGFVYELPGEYKTQIRGGVGLFQGRNPNVWITNAYQTAGTIGTVNVSNANASGVVFNPDPDSQTAPAGNPPAPSITAIDPSFKQPTLWKSNLAIDRTLPWDGWIASAELTYNWTDRAVLYQFLNFVPGTGGPATLPDGRPRFGAPGIITPAISGTPSASSSGRRRINTFADVFYLTNSREGEAKGFTLSLRRPMKNNWAASAAWTWSDATEVSPMTSSTASSNFQNRASFSPNEDVASTSNYNIKQKFVATYSREFRFIENAKTTVSLVYEARAGRPYSWVFRGDANGDGYNFNDLFYVPTGPTDPKVAWASATERDAFFAFVENSTLKNYKGSHPERNSETMPWNQTLDLKFTQEIPLRGRIRAEVFCNIVNFANLIDEDWGILEEVIFSYRRSVAGATYNAAGNGGQGQWNYVFNQNTLDNLPIVVNETPASRWQVQVGTRLRF